MKKDFKQHNEENYQLLDDIYNYLEEYRGIVLLEPMSLYRKEQIHNLVKEYPGLKMSSVLEGEDTRVFLCRKSLRPKDSYVKYKKKGLEEFRNGEYDNCIETFKDIIENYTYIDSTIYETIGLANLKKQNNEEAVNYLIVSTYISSIEDERNPKDYSVLINDILGINRKKSYLKRRGLDKGDVFYSKEFIMNESYNYGINNIDDIKEYAAKNRVSLEEACNHFGLSNEKKDMLKLIIARDFFKEGNFEQGNIYLNNVAETRGKTEAVIDFMDEIREKKGFYQFRNDNKKKTLTYIKPGKRY